MADINPNEAPPDLIAKARSLLGPTSGPEYDGLADNMGTGVAIAMRDLLEQAVTMGFEAGGVSELLTKLVLSLGDGADGETLCGFLNSRKRLLYAEEQWILARFSSTGLAAESYAKWHQEHEVWRQRLLELHRITIDPRLDPRLR